MYGRTRSQLTKVYLIFLTIACPTRLRVFQWKCHELTDKGSDASQQLENFIYWVAASQMRQEILLRLLVLYAMLISPNIKLVESYFLHVYADLLPESLEMRYLSNYAATYPSSSLPQPYDVSWCFPKL